MAGVIFAEMDLGDLYSVPEANAENKALELELQVKHKEKSNLENKISQHQEMIQGLSEILQNINQELLLTQALSKAVEKEAETERHFKALTDRETGSLRQETAPLDKELSLLTERKNTLEREILKGSHKMEKIEKQLNLDQQTIADRLREFMREEEDTLILVKYCRQDELRIKELTLRIEKTTTAIHQKQKALDEERTQLIAAQVALERVTEDLNRAHSERQEVILQWESTIGQMRKRDRDLEQGIMALPQVHREVREKQSVIPEMKNQLEIQQIENQKCEKKLAAAEELARKRRVEVRENDCLCGQLRSEFEVLKSSVEQVAARVDAARSQLTSLKNDKKDKSLKLKDGRLLLEALERKMKDVTESAISVEMLPSIIAQTLEEEELKSAELERKVLRYRGVTSEKTQDVQALKAKEQNLLTEISTTRDLLKTLLRHHQNAEAKYLENQSLIQHQDFQISGIKAKLGRLTGAQNSEDDQDIKQEMSELLKTLEERKKTSKMLSNQLRTLEIKVCCAKGAAERVESQSRDLSSALGEMQLCQKNAERELKKLVIKNQESVFDQNFLKLDVKRIRDRFQSENERVISLEKQKLTREAGMKKEEVKVDWNRDMLKTKVKISSQENHRLRMEMNEILIRIDKMKTKYETIAVPIVPPDDDGSHALASYMVQVAQEEVKRKGDQLDKKVSKKETEIQALENTLHAINRRTELYKVPGVLNQSTEDYQKYLQLEELRKVEDENYKSKLRQIRELQQDIDGMNDTLVNLHQEEATLKERREESRTDIFSLTKELECDKKKLERATNQCSKVTGYIRSSKNTKSKTKEECEIDLSQLKDFDRMVERKLLVAMDEDPDLRSVLQTYFQEQNLPLPEPVFPLASHLTPGLRSSSVRSVQSSCSSSSIFIVSPAPGASKPAHQAGSAPVRSSSGVHLRSEFSALQTPKPASQLSTSHSSLSSGSSAPRPSQPQHPRGEMVDLGLQIMVTSAISSSPPCNPRRASPATGRDTPNN